jgi:nucleotidyltransferase substrate binding protein (TIGR01987 family)
MSENIRWKQRFANYRKAISQLNEFLEQPGLNKFEKQGLIQCFEYTFELAWKTMKDYLEETGYSVNSPRSAIQTAFQAQLIADGYLWIDALEKRKLMSHTYNEELAEEAEKLIRNNYCGILNALLREMDAKI